MDRVPAIDFLLGRITDHRGRSIEFYSEMDYTQIEECHDYIQWAFPTVNRSAYNPSAPTLPEDFKSKDVGLTVGESDTIHRNMFVLLRKYFDALGIEVTFDANALLAPAKFKVREGINPSLMTWADRQNHNTLRITRIIESLYVLWSDKQAKELLDFLMYEIVPHNPNLSSVTVAFWYAASENSIHRIR